MINFWDERYQQTAYIYGEQANEFFATQLSKLPAGQLILPCDGEGRNAVFAAKNGWQVAAFDNSEIGKEKALALANKNQVTINYDVNSAQTIDYPENSVDLVAFIYAHLPAEIRKEVHQKSVKWLKKGGKIILEAFHPEQLKNTSGGPKDLDMLYTEEMILSDFEFLEVELIENESIVLNEGAYHQGNANVTRFVGVKV
jgi:hypothetical protein